MLTRFAAQTLVDGLSAVTLCASVLMIAQRKPASPMRTRLGFAFGGLFVLFLARTVGSAFGLEVLHLVALEVVCALPLAALLLAEGVLRRHAPWPLKLLVTAGGAAMAVSLYIADGRAPVASLWLGGYVILSLVAVAALLLARDRASLSYQENASVNGLIVSGLFLILLSVTDFVPDLPLGLSGVGAAALALALGANPTTRQETLSVLLNLLILILLAGLSALAFAIPFNLADPGEQICLGATLLALLFAAQALLNLRQARIGHSAQGFAQALAQADTSNLQAFLESLAEQPLLAGMRVSDGAALADYDSDLLGKVMAARAVWTRVPADQDVDMPERAREQLDDLMARSDATHAVMLCQMPLRIALLTLPSMGPDGEVGVHLALFQKLAAMAAKAS